jgi:hypothetical protein
MASMRPERAYSPAARASRTPDPSRVLVIGCGALARELVAVIDQAGLANVDLTCLPATLHNRPGGIPAAVRAKIRAARPRYERIFVAYADCGTGGLLDLALADEGVDRLPGAHCYELYSGSNAFAAMSEEDPATFYLTDFLARNFDRLVITGLGLDRHPELLPAYFGNYHRLVYLAQTDDPALVAGARRAARRLGLAFELRRTGYGDLATGLVAAARPAGAGPAPAAATPSVPDGDGFAPGATNVAAAGRIRPRPARSLRPEQERASEPITRVAGGRPEDDSRRRTSSSRLPAPSTQRLLLPVQRRGGMLRGQQESGTASAAARMTAPAPTRSTRPAPTQARSTAPTAEAT